MKYYDYDGEVRDSVPTDAEVEAYSEAERRQSRLELAGMLAVLAGLSCKITNGRIRIWNESDTWSYETSDPMQAVNWLDGYTLGNNRIV